MARNRVQFQKGYSLTQFRLVTDISVISARPLVLTFAQSGSRNLCLVRYLDHLSQKIRLPFFVTRPGSIFTSNSNN